MILLTMGLNLHYFVRPVADPPDPALLRALLPVPTPSILRFCRTLLLESRAHARATIPQTCLDALPAMTPRDQFRWMGLALMRATPCERRGAR
jgi:hypothetical protein